MKKETFVSRYFNSKNNVEIIIDCLLDTDENYELTLKCGQKEIEEKIIKKIPSNSKEWNVRVIIFDGKEVKSYKKEHINIRYLITKKCFPDKYNKKFHEIELEISDIYEKFKKSIPHPFDKILDD